MNIPSTLEQLEDLFQGPWFSVFLKIATDSDDSGVSGRERRVLCPEETMLIEKVVEGRATQEQKAQAAALLADNSMAMEFFVQLVSKE